MTGLSNRYRHAAREHFVKAEALLATGDDEVIRYAALELRLTIESLCYGLLVAYRNEIPKSGLRHWTPKQVLDELLQADPRATSDVAIRSARQDAGPPRFKSLGTERRFSVKWANKNHNALSRGALHVPSVQQTIDGAGFSPSKLRDTCTGVATKLREVIASPIWHVNLAQFYSFACDCGFEIKRRSDLVKSGDRLVCSDCGRTYDVLSAGETILVEKSKVRWECFGCNETVAFDELELTDHVTTNCPKCGRAAELRKQWVVIDQPGAD
ncbi:hypothetical protein CK215_14490 [Mesorhizobium sp. WSM3864]|uniref:hypothetical protein n=1 Tax=Mesorhizobium sp. WSM3864 TaxID=2029404 RepID=UPI000BAF966F|nr:hypothetical protein [Mesorhizobium sp. WSM3864]PBB92130.1 hypothetical protein CK215_14490 [Mesorhizobium sp. WSM3864]